MSNFQSTLSDGFVDEVSITKLSSEKMSQDTADGLPILDANTYEGLITIPFGTHLNAVPALELQRRDGYMGQ